MGILTIASPAQNSKPMAGVGLGRICMICDIKFMLYDYYSEFACQVEELDAQIKEDQEIMRAKYTEFR